MVPDNIEPATVWLHRELITIIIWENLILTLRKSSSVGLWTWSQSTIVRSLNDPATPWPLTWILRSVSDSITSSTSPVIHRQHTTSWYAGWSSLPGDCCSSVECSSVICSFCAIVAAAVPPRPEDSTVSVIVLFTIVSSCVTDCNCNLVYCKVPR